MAPKTRNVGRKRKERSPIVEFPPEDAEELIDLTVSKIVETTEEGESSKHNSAAAASTTIEVYRPPGALQTLNDAGGVVTLDELSLLERDEVYPYLDLSHLQHDKGFVNISYALFSRGTRPGIDVYTVDLSDSGLKKFMDFPAMGLCSRVVPGSVIEKHFLDQLGCDCLKKSYEGVKAQEEAMQAEMREGALRDKHEKLQREYSSQKEVWEARNQKLSEDISVLHEERLRITAREDNMQGELAQIRSLLLQPRELSDVKDVLQTRFEAETLPSSSPCDRHTISEVESDGCRGKISDWTYLWDYSSNKCWIFSAKGTRGETTCHNRALVTVAIDVPRGDDALQMLCKINMALCIRLRPWDGIFLEHFAQALLVMPWALDILNTLVEKELVTVWRTGHIPLQVLQSKDSYKTDASYDAMKPLWSVSKVWECDDPSHSRVITPDIEADDSDHYCRPPPTLPPDLPLWLATGAYSSSLPSSSGLPCTD
ncbi:hypothetical protein R1sor_008764 [Riccia sorocarpa]|uniref:Uncharacterized protein n=1 Tax=Riccia sorocarpa TaxID=122646 RepID=A0ABD3HUI9_9MARC